METKHTPGPWKESTTYARKQARKIDIVPWADQTLVIARLGETTSNEQTYANARLIAAAPALLEACKAVMEWAKTPVNHGGNPYYKTFVRQAEAAIALAEKGE